MAKLYNLNLTMEDLDNIEEGLKYMDIIKEYKKFKEEVEPLVNYIINVENSHIPDSMIKNINKAKEEFFIIRDEIRENLDGEIASRQITNLLNPIKKQYIEYYFDKHTKARLGASESRRKGEIMNSNTLSNLKKLIEIQGIFPKNKLEHIEGELAKLQTCFELSTKDLQKNHICNKCRFTLLENNITVAGKLDLIEENLEKLTEDWTNSLLSALEDPLIMENKSLLNKEQQQLIDKFLEKQELPDIVDTFFVNTFNTLFEDLDKVDIDAWEMMEIVQNLGPSTVEDLKAKLNNFIDKQVEGKDLDKVRIIIKSDSNKKTDLLIADSEESEGGNI